MKETILRIYRRLLLHRWNIGFVDLTDNYLLERDYLKIKWIKHPYKDRWFADPFILSESETTIDVLVEEFYDRINRGRISKLTIDKSTLELTRLKVVLELDSHLSFPAIVKIEDSIYVYPENSESNQLILYKFDDTTETLIPMKVMINEPLTDAILTMQFGKPILFSTSLPNQNKDILQIYHAEDWFGPYSFGSSFQFKDNTARGAGRLIEYCGKLLRPAQNCNDTYGGGLVFYEIIKLDTGHFDFIELKRFSPRSWKYNLGMHTFDSDGSLGVVDGRGFRLPVIGHVIWFLRNLVINKK
jgi:hypothetical protein